MLHFNPSKPPSIKTSMAMAPLEFLRRLLGPTRHLQQRSSCGTTKVSFSNLRSSPLVRQIPTADCPILRTTYCGLDFSWRRKRSRLIMDFGKTSAVIRPSPLLIIQAYPTLRSFWREPSYFTRLKSAPAKPCWIRVPWRRITIGKMHCFLVGGVLSAPNGRPSWSRGSNQASSSECLK